MQEHVFKFKQNLPQNKPSPRNFTGIPSPKATMNDANTPLQCSDKFPGYLGMRSFHGNSFPSPHSSIVPNNSIGCQI